MAGITLSERDTSLLQEIIDELARLEPEPIPWPALEKLAELLHTDQVNLGGYCTAPAHVWFLNAVDHDGRGTEQETPEEALANPFWQHYWRVDCSYPDRSGDYDSITTLSDFTSLRELRRTRVEPVPYEREIMACIPLAAHRQLRLLGWRHGPDFTERDRFLLRLLRPHVREHYLRWRQQHTSANELTPRQLAVLSLVREGYTNGQIGRRLRLSEGTVRTHLNNVYERLGVQSRTAAVAAVYRDAG